MSATTTQQQPETLNLTELAALLGIGLDALKRKRTEGSIPKPILDGRYPRWSRQQIERWLEGDTRTQR